MNCTAIDSLNSIEYWEKRITQIKKKYEQGHFTFDAMKDRITSCFRCIIGIENKEKMGRIETKDDLIEYLHITQEEAQARFLDWVQNKWN